MIYGCIALTGAPNGTHILKVMVDPAGIISYKSLQTSNISSPEAAISHFKDLVPS